MNFCRASRNTYQHTHLATWLSLHVVIAAAAAAATEDEVDSRGAAAEADLVTEVDLEVTEDEAGVEVRT